MLSLFSWNPPGVPWPSILSFLNMKIYTLCWCICSSVWINEWKPIFLRAGCLSWVGMPTIIWSPLCCHAWLLRLPLSWAVWSDREGFQWNDCLPITPSPVLLPFQRWWPSSSLTLLHSTVDFPTTEELPLRARCSLEGPLLSSLRSHPQKFMPQALLLRSLFVTTLLSLPYLIFSVSPLMRPVCMRPTST